MALFNKLKQVQELRAKSKQIKNALSEEKVTGEAEHTMITITLDGTSEVQSVHIDPTLLSADNQEKVERGVKDAYADAFKKLQRLIREKMQRGEIPSPEL